MDAAHNAAKAIKAGRNHEATLPTKNLLEDTADGLLLLKGGRSQPSVTPPVRQPTALSLSADVRSTDDFVGF